MTKEIWVFSDEFLHIRAIMSNFKCVEQDEEAAFILQLAEDFYLKVIHNKVHEDRINYLLAPIWKERQQLR